MGKIALGKIFLVSEMVMVEDEESVLGCGRFFAHLRYPNPENKGLN